MKKVLFTATVVKHIQAFHLPYLKWFKDQGWETWVATNTEGLDGDLPGCDRLVHVDFARSPFTFKTGKAYSQLISLFANEHFDLVHTHTPVASVLTRLAARKARMRGTKVIYTAHGFHFYDGAPTLNWVLWYPVEVLMSRMTDCLLTINEEDYTRARRFAHCEVEYVPGVGVDLQHFNARPRAEREREMLSISKNEIAVLAIGDLNKNKNHKVLIDALVSLPPSVKLFIAGEGSMKESLLRHAESVGVSDRVRLLGYRRDIPDLLNAADVFCMPSLREGLPVSLIESMATGTTSLASDVRGCRDILAPFADECVVNPNEGGAWARAISLWASQDKRDAAASSFRRRACDFDVERAVAAAGAIYRRVLGEEPADE